MPSKPTVAPFLLVEQYLIGVQKRLASLEALPKPEAVTKC